MQTKLQFFCKNILPVCLLIVCSTVLPEFSFSAIRIDSVKTTISVCPNNGSITVYASSNAAPILYSITAGPVTQPVQTGNVFNSLPPGIYTVKVSNTLLEAVTMNVTVAGNYVLPEFNPLSVNPYCAHGNDGQIIGNILPGTGTAPYTWQLIAPSPLLSGPQATDTFNNLVSGNYTVRVTDACGSFRTVVATVTDPNSAFSFQFIPGIEIIGCDSGLITLYLKFPDGRPRMPLSYKYQTRNGIFIPTPGSEKTDSSQLPSFVTIQQVIPNITYGDTVVTTIYNTCGDSVTYTSIIDPYNFTPVYKYDSCGRFAFVDFNYIIQPYIHYGLKVPVHYIFTDVVSNAVIDSATIHGDSTHNFYNMITGIAIHSQVTVGNTYSLTVTDGCGKLFQKNYFTPTMPPPAILEINLLYPACIDSALGLLRVHVTGFSNPKLVLLSGPATLGSTKPGYSYTDTFTYPDTVNVGSGGEYFFLNNLAPGTYQFKVIDDCGNEIPDSFSVDSSAITSLAKAVRYEKGCLGQNKIFYTLSHGDPLFFLNQGGAATIKVTNLSTAVVLKNQLYYGNIVNDSVLNLASGTYEVSFGFEQGGYGTYINDSVHSCLTLKDTIFIAGYQTPVIATGNAILCHNSINILVVPDSTKGVPPYQYEIIAGPQIFPVQASNIFTVNTAGTYTARIYDICGNASTANITADTLSFPPVSPVKTSCTGIKLFLGSSAYYTYTWTNPFNQVYTGDTLVIDPVTAADTGIYHIKRMVDINGCKDTFNTTYRLNFPLSYKQANTICSGNSVTIGSSTYNSTGIYRDTLTSSIGCDSIVVLDLTVLPYKKDSLVKNICAGKSISIGTHTYNQAGIYRDTLSTAGCDSIVVLNLIIDPLKKDSLVKSICAGQNISIGTHTYNQTGIYRDTLSTTGCDSIVVLNLSIDPLKKDSLVKNICIGQSIAVGTHTYTQAGIYRDTLSTTGCDSIVILNLIIDPLKKDSSVKNICIGQSIAVGSHVYNQTGIYRDTLSTATCDSVVILNLIIDPLKKDSLVKNICAGQSISIGTHTYNQAGIYRDTLSTATCDSIVILNLRIDPLKKDSVVKNICIGQSIAVGTHVYNQTGIYRDTLSTATCDSVVILNLRIDPLKRDSLVKNICIGQSIAVGTHVYNQAGIYRDTLSTPTCDSIVILNLRIDPLKKDSSVKNICAGQSIAVGTHVYNQTGIYRDTLSTATCDSVAILDLRIIPIKKDSVAQAICAGQSVSIGTHTYTQAGIYRDTLSTATCDSIVTLNLTVTPAPAISITATPQAVSSGGIVQLNATPAASYLWSSMATLSSSTIQAPTAIVVSSSWIYLLVTANTGNCTALDSVFVRVIPDTVLPCIASSYIYMPNAFTPNGDAKHDVFRIFSNNIVLRKFQVYNRWGEMVFETADVTKGWDGMYKGQILAGNYVYFVSYFQCNLTSLKLLKGSVILIR